MHGSRGQVLPGLGPCFNMFVKAVVGHDWTIKSPSCLNIILRPSLLRTPWERLCCGCLDPVSIVKIPNMKTVICIGIAIYSILGLYDSFRDGEATPRDSPNKSCRVEVVFDHCYFLSQQIIGSKRHISRLQLADP